MLSTIEGSVSKELADQTKLLELGVDLLPVIGSLGVKARAALDSIGPDSLTGQEPGSI